MLGDGIGVAVDQAEAVRHTKHSCSKTLEVPRLSGPKSTLGPPLVLNLLGRPNFLGTCPVLVKPQVTSETECARPETFSLVLLCHWLPLHIPSICPRLAPHHQLQTAGEAARLTTKQLQQVD